MKVDSIKKFLKKQSWVIPIILFFLGFIFGPGVLWQYKNIGIMEQKLLLDKIKMESDIRNQISELQSEITQLAKKYICDRDNFLKNSKGGLTKERYKLQNQYNHSKSRMVKLITDYNVLEIKLSLLEKRNPIFFKVSSVIPPTTPTKFEIPKDSSDSSNLSFILEWKEDAVKKEVRMHLKSLFELHGQDYKSKTQPANPLDRR